MSKDILENIPDGFELLETSATELSHEDMGVVISLFHDEDRNHRPFRVIGAQAQSEFYAGVFNTEAQAEEKLVELANNRV